MIDAHQHVWAIGRNGCAWPTPADGVLYRDYGLDDFAAAAEPLGVRGTILVQSQEDAADTDWLIAIAAAEPRVAAVVGWCDLAAPDAPARIGALAGRGKLAGLRPMVQQRGSDWYDDPARDPGFAAMAETGLRLDALVRVRHLASLGRLARRRPDLAIVVDHAAKPRIPGPDGFASWRSAMAPLAERPNVWCKLSGLLTECGPQPTEAIQPYVDALLDLFGPERLMWGSDWPVLLGAAGYGEWLELARRLVPRPAHAAIFGGTAARFYGIGTDGPESRLHASAGMCA